MLHFLNPSRGFVLDIDFNIWSFPNSCSKLSPSFCDGHTYSLQECCYCFKITFTDNESSLGGIWVLAIFRAKFRDVPQCLELWKISTHALWNHHGYGIHCQSEWISLGGALLGEKNFSISGCWLEFWWEHDKVGKCFELLFANSIMHQREGWH